MEVMVVVMVIIDDDHGEDEDGGGQLILPIAAFNEGESNLIWIVFCCWRFDISRTHTVIFWQVWKHSCWGVRGVSVCVTYAMRLIQVAQLWNKLVDLDTTNTPIIFLLGNLYCFVNKIQLSFFWAGSFRF